MQSKRVLGAALLLCLWGREGRDSFCVGCLFSVGLLLCCLGFLCLVCLALCCVKGEEEDDGLCPRWQPFVLHARLNSDLQGEISALKARSKAAERK